MLGKGMIIKTKLKMQSKKHSLIEAITNTSVGFIISLLSTFIIFPLVGIESTGTKNVIITLFFTAISILRGYVIRRFFNKKNRKKCANNWHETDIHQKGYCPVCGEGKIKVNVKTENLLK